MCLSNYPLKTLGSFGAVKKVTDTEFAGDDSATLISVCLCIFEISIPNLTLEILYCHLFEIFPSTCSHCCRFLFTSVRGWHFQAKHLSFKNKICKIYVTMVTQLLCSYRVALLVEPYCKESNISVSNRPFYSCRLSDLASEWQRGWSWPCFDGDLTTFIVQIKLFLC